MSPSESATRSPTPPATPSADDCRARIGKLIGEGQFLLAFDTFRAAIDHHPDNLALILQGALALLCSDAPEEAELLLAPVRDRLETRQRKRRRVVAAFHAATAPDADDAAISRFMDAIEAPMVEHEKTETTEALRLVGQIEMQIWARTGRSEHVGRGFDCAVEAFALTGAASDGVVAAVLAKVSGDDDEARRLATRITELDAPPSTAAADLFNHHAARGEAFLILGQPLDAGDAIEVATASMPRHYPTVVAALDRLDLIGRAGVAVPEVVTDLLRPPRSAIFAGQPLDTPDAAAPLFPPHLEATVAHAIRERLDRLDIEIGYCSASAGSDLLFMEAMLDRGAEVNVFLPYDLDDVIAHGFAHAGDVWVRRFRNALQLATSVSHATYEPFLGHHGLHRYNNTLIEGMARAQSALRHTEPDLIAVWHHAAEPRPGNAADFIHAWPDIGRLHLIDLEELAAAAPLQHADAGPARSPAPRTAATEPERVIRTMVFADMTGYSRLDDADLPGLWRSLHELSELKARYAAHLELVESWGDAIYSIMGAALPMVDYAFDLLDGIERVNAAAPPAVAGLSLRLALHAGPVYQGTNPLTGRPIVYGSHVSRAARMEPISPPGYVYASEQFVAMLLSEDNARRHAAAFTGDACAQSYSCSYIGNLSLAKKYDRQPVYAIRRRIVATAT